MFNFDGLTPELQALLKTIDPIELAKVVPMPEAERLSGISDDSWRRNHPDKVVRLGPRRVGVRVGDALMLKRSSSSA